SVFAVSMVLEYPLHSLARRELPVEGVLGISCGLHSVCLALVGASIGVAARLVIGVPHLQKLDAGRRGSIGSLRLFGLLAQYRRNDQKNHRESSCRDDCRYQPSSCASPEEPGTGACASKPSGSQFDGTSSGLLRSPA